MAATDGRSVAKLSLTTVTSAVRRVISSPEWWSETTLYAFSRSVPNAVFLSRISKRPAMRTCRSLLSIWSARCNKITAAAAAPARTSAAISPRSAASMTYFAQRESDTAHTESTALPKTDSTNSPRTLAALFHIHLRASSRFISVISLAMPQDTAGRGTKAPTNAHTAGSASP